MKIGLYIAPFLLLLISLVGLESFFLPQDKVVFLDIGQGDSILFQRGTQQVLVDGGAGAAVLARLAEEMPWFDKRVDVIVSTHPDKDHLEGLLQVLRRYEVGLVMLPAVPHTSQLQESWINELEKQLDERGVKVQIATRGQRLVLDQLSFHVLSPWPELIAALHGETNNGSVVMRADYGDLSVLLTGDAEFSTEQQLVAQDPGNLQVDILKVGHHGSKGSSGAEFLKAVSPRLAAISVGKNNAYGHPTSETLARLTGMPVVRTDESGSVRLTAVNGKWLLSCTDKSCMKGED